jgi:predicted permease
VLGIDPGFAPANVVSGYVSLPRARYANAEALRSFSERTLERIRAIPGIERAGITDTVPFGGDYSDSVILAEGYVMTPGESLISPTTNSVSPDYFETMRIPLGSGRAFDARDTAASPRVVIVDRKLARKFWPGKDPVGRRLFSPDGADLTKPGPNSTFYTVVGVVEDVPMYGLAEEDTRVGAYYFPLAQDPPGSFSFVARTSLASEAAAAAIRKEIAAIDPEVPFYGVQMMDERIAESLVSRRMPMLLAVAFGVVALFLSAIGIYGVLAYQVAQRRREIGIRMALGSTIGAVFGLVLRDGAKIVIAGLVLGLAGAFLTSRYIETQLFGVRALDPAVIASVAVILAVVSFAAVAIPARRAARVNPVIALAGE